MNAGQPPEKCLESDLAFQASQGSPYHRSECSSFAIASSGTPLVGERPAKESGIVLQSTPGWQKLLAIHAGRAWSAGS